MEQELHSTTPRYHNIVVWVIIASILTILAGIVGLPVGLLRVPAGLVISLFAPGYAGLLALGYIRQPGGINHFVFSIPVSLSFSILAGVFLNITHLGVRLDTMAIILCALSILLLLGAWQRHRLLEWARPVRPVTVQAPKTAISARVLAIVALLLGASLVAAVWMGYGIITASQDLPVPFTELYALNTPTLTTTGNTSSKTELRLGLNNNETRPMTYTLQLFVQPDGGSALLADEQRIVLASGETWQGTIPVDLTCNDSLIGQLLLPGQQSAYRTIHIRPDCPAKP
ncbi:MAG: DUF1616 domain-containing protein [Chloroflexota bacterium]